MSKERYQRLKELLFEASEREGRARADYLDEQCRDDADLRAEIDRLLSDSEPPTTKVGGHIARRALPETGPGLREAPDLQGLWFGRYQLVELLGEGGMGSVWLAQQQEPVRRQVALKVIRLGLDSQCVVTRFEAERQALALMDHHAIARVFDGGVGPGGRPYFVMEHVPGTAITRYCDEQSLTLEQRIELFIEVCDAIHHAHQKGVIHRDLKPSNILVARGTDGPIVKVIDFGIAKAINRKLTDETLVTEVSQILGTPEYMAPEQTDRARNDVDIRADIYSLGVVLYELITGTRPFELASIATLGYEALLDHIRAVDPPLPSARVAALDDASRQRISQARGESTRSFGRQLRGDIDWVVRRSLEKDRDRRYASATALADDLRRYLTHEPVLVKAPSWTYLLRKFYRRYRGVAAKTPPR
ncbi:MAG: serine/threonine-protein kinase, partial [Planctomycetota bacterium]